MQRNEKILISTKFLGWDIQMGIKSITVQVPKVLGRDGSLVTFQSALVPAYTRKTKSLEVVLTRLRLSRQSYQRRQIQ